MVVRRRKKTRKLRGRTRSMGYGRIGQHRKSGSKGGVGAAGYHKHFWSWVVKYYPDWFGKHGFTRHPSLQTVFRTMNVGELNELVKELERTGVLARSGGMIEINLTSLGVNKLLGRGRIDRPVRVTVYAATELAIKKVREAGGEVIITKPASEGG